MAMAHSYETDESVGGAEGCVLRRTARRGATRPPWTINDIGPWFSRRYDGTIAGFCPVCLPLLLPRLHVFFLLLLFPLPFLSPLERRQVGVRAAVNSPAPLSTLMSLLLFALLNAIRAYSVSLPPLLGARRYHVVLSTCPAHKRGGSRTDALTYTRARSSIFAARLFRAHVDSATGTRTRTQHADVRVTRGIALGGRRGHSNQPQTCIRTLLCNF